MGCGASKPDDEGGRLTFPTRLRPLFLRRIEDIRRLRNTRTLKDTAPSQKEPLVHGVEDDETSSHNRRTVSSPDDSVSCVTSEGSKGEKGRTTKEASGKDQSFKQEENHVTIRKVTERKIIEALTTVENGSDEDIEDDAEEEEDDEVMISHEEGEEICPGSPSFRVYFLENMKDEDNNDGDGGKDDELNISPQEEDASLSKESVTKNVKKRRKRRSFRKVMIIPKGGQAAVKNLLNVRSCITSAGSAHDRSHLLTGKTSA